MAEKNNYSQEVLHYLKKLNFKIGDMIPKEEELSKALDISKVSIKKTLNYLKMQGYLHSVKGTGTFLSYDFSTIFNAINNNLSITELIRLSGYEPGIKSFQKELIRVDKELSEKMRLEEGTSVIVYKRTRTADGEPVCYSFDYISPIITKDFLNVTDQNISLYTHVENNCGIKIGTNITDIVPVLCTEELHDALDVEVGQPLQLFKQYVMDVKGRLVMYGVEYFRTDKFRFIIDRRRMV